MFAQPKVLRVSAFAVHTFARIFRDLLLPEFLFKQFAESFGGEGSLLDHPQFAGCQLYVDVETSGNCFLRFGFFLPVWQRPQVAWAACLPAGLFGLSVGRRTLCLSLGGHFLSRWRTQGTKEINMNRELYENEDTLAQINVLFVKFFKNKLNCYCTYNYQDRRYIQCSCNFICLYI